MDLAASVQLATQEAVLGLARHARELTDSPNLCMAGGVALNCVANGLLSRERLFDKVWIQPAASDAGGALGAALLGAHVLLSVPRHIPADAPDGQNGSLLGPSYSSAGLRALLDDLDCEYEVIGTRRKRARRIAAHLAAGDVVALCSGPLEFGPRALGSRSILADPRQADMQTRLNIKVKFRESFRPFAPAVLLEECGEYFEFDGASPYMLMTAPVRASHRTPPNAAAIGDDLLAIVRGRAGFAHRLGAGRATGSAYSAPDTGAEFCELENLDAVRELLLRTWRAPDLHPARELVQPLLELAEELINEDEGGDTGEVTSYIYTLF